MIDRELLVNYLDELLECNKFKDYAPNGLQVEGRKDIYKICAAVTAGLDVVAAAVAAKADLLLVHHGYFWNKECPKIVGMKKQRLGLILQNDLNLCAYHLPIDTHLTLGNNAGLAKALQVDKVKYYEAEGIQNIIWTGETKQPFAASDYAVFLEKALQKPIFLSGGDKPINKIAWVTGAAQNFIEQAAALGVDAFITGEVSEATYYRAKELGVHFFACGHHRTETFGVQAVCEHLADKYNLEYEYIEVDNPI